MKFTLNNLKQETKSETNAIVRMKKRNKKEKQQQIGSRSRKTEIEAVLKTTVYTSEIGEYCATLPHTTTYTQELRRKTHKYILVF